MRLEYSKHSCGFPQRQYYTSVSFSILNYGQIKDLQGMQMASNQTLIDIIILNCTYAKLQYTILFFWSPQGRYECDFCVFFIDYGQNKDLRHVDGPKSNINGNKSYWYDPQLLMYEIETRKVVVLVPPEDVTMRFLCSSHTFSGRFCPYLKKYDT